jgi:hypothetical protein
VSAPRRDREPDPLGKRALFWVPSAEEVGGAGTATAALPAGKHALYSGAGLEGQDVAVVSGNPLADRGPFAVECQRCRTVSRVGLLDMVIFQFPVGFWLPGRRFDHRMTCPACRARTWCSVTLRRG